MKLPDGVSSLVYRDDDGREIVRKLQPEWIPTKERVPTTREDVLITHSNGVSVGYWTGAYWTSGRRSGRMLKTVTAWMPFPEPYKEVEK